MCCIFFVIRSSKFLHTVCILPIGMLCVSAWGILFVNIVLAVCILVGVDVSENVAYVSLVNCVQSVFLSLMIECLPMLLKFLFLCCIDGDDNW